MPEGYISDGSSIPKIFWSLIGSPMGESAQSGFLHDFLYTKQGNVQTLIGFPISRKRCDDIFLESMKVLKINFFKRRLIWLAVRIFGETAWRKKNG